MQAERRRALVVSAVVAVAVAVPGVRLLAAGPDAPDGFPLSTYPMFTRDPGQVVELPTVVAVGPGGEVERLSPETIAATDQVIQAAEAVGRAVRDGPAAASALCREVAARLDDDSTGDGAGRLRTVAVVVERHDALAWAEGDREPLDRRTVAECPVAGS
jgi:hypothetical protein